MSSTHSTARSVVGPRLVLLVLLAALFPASCTCGGDEPQTAEVEPTEPEMREIVLGGAPTEHSEPALLAAPQPTMRDVLARIRAVRDSGLAKGLFLRLGPLEGAWARSADLAQALKSVRDAGKPVHCHFEVADNASYALLASSCDRLTMTPAGYLDLVGLAAQAFYAKSLLGQIGLEADLIQMGRFKGAADPFTRDDMPPEVRESLDYLLDDLHGDLVHRIAEGRHLPPGRVQELLDDGPHDALSARNAGLIDDAEFDDEAREHARQAAGVERVREIELTPRPAPMGLGDLLGALSGETQTARASGTRVVLATLTGTISDSEEGGGMDESGRSGPFVAAMRRFARDPDVKAVVLRIDSPGGSALASDRMWHAVRRVVRAKPVIVSVGDMAASGGYYIACAGTRVYAQDTSLIGSIGVVGGKVVARELATRLGVNVVSLERGRNAGWSSVMRPFSDSERRSLTRMMGTTYARFLGRVAEGRNIDVARVSLAAEGRIMSGRRAREAGLVDASGSLEDAMAEARRQAHLQDDVAIEEWPARKSLLDALAEATGGGQDAQAMRLVRQITEATGPLGAAVIQLPQLLEHEPVATSLPFVVRIR